MPGRQLETIEFQPDELVDLADKCVDFTEMFTARTFYPYQRVFAAAICRDVLGGLGGTLTGLFARQSGKSETVANTGAALMVILPRLANLKDGKKFLFPQLDKFRKGLLVGIFSPSNFQSSTTYGRLRDRFIATEAKMFLESEEFAAEGYSSIQFITNKNDHLKLNNGSECLMMSADKQSKIESKTFHLILLDESQDLDDFVIGKSVMPMGAHTNASTVATGTPGITKGYFYNQIEKNKTEQLSRTREHKLIQPQLHFQNDYKTVIKYQSNYKKYIAKEKKRIGEESDEFQMAYCLIWLLERGMAVPEPLFRELSIKDLKVHTSMVNVELVAGLDWGKGSDSTVLTIGRPNYDLVDESGKAPVEVVAWWERVGDDYEAIFAGVKEQFDNYSIRTVCCDATGVGEPLVDRLTWELPFVTVVPVKFSAQSKDHLYKFFLLMLQEKKVSWPGGSDVRTRRYWKMFENQMLNLQKEYKGQYLTCHKPEDMRNSHDDFPDSLALMMWCINEMAMPYVEVSTDNVYKGHDWKRDPYGQFSLKGGRY